MSDVTDIVAIAASCVVGAVFLIAGASKVVARERWTADARELGAPAGLVPAVPYGEIALGAALVARVAPVVVALIAFAVLAVFTLLIARVLGAGRRPTCACFGALSRRPLGWRHVARNGALMAVCIVAML